MDNKPKRKTPEQLLMEEILRRYDEFYYCLGLLKGLIDKYEEKFKQ